MASLPTLLKIFNIRLTFSWRQLDFILIIIISTWLVARSLFSSTWNLNIPDTSSVRIKKLVNAGNLEIPEGTVVHWNLSAMNTRKATILFSSDSSAKDFKTSDNQLYSYEKNFRSPDQYEIALVNDESQNRERIAYHIDVVKDQFPQISVNNYRDSILYQRIILGGGISDDYGISQLSLHFRVVDDKQKEMLSRNVNIPVSRSQQQSFFYNWSVDSLKLNPGDQLEYYLQVWDNDGVNGRKSTKTARYSFCHSDRRRNDCRHFKIPVSGGATY